LGYSSNPFANDINHAEKYYYSGGFGFRDKHFFVDLAYMRSRTTEDYYFYGSENVSVNPVSNQLITNNVILTLGVRY